MASTKTPFALEIEKALEKGREANHMILLDIKEFAEVVDRDAPCTIKFGLKGSVPKPMGFKKPEEKKAPPTGPKKPFDPFMPPFSKGSFIKEFPDHNLIINKFPFFNPQLVLCTKDMQQQTEAFRPLDFAAAMKIIKDWGPDVDAIGFLNSGPAAGASMPHRHFHFIRGTHEEGKPHALFQWVDKSRAVAGSDYSRVMHLKCHHRIYNFKTAEERTIEYLHKCYLEFFNWQEKNPQSKAYNVIFNQDFMFCIPRSQANVLVNGARIGNNSCTWIGTLPVFQKAELEAVKRAGVFSILDQLGVMEAIVD